MGMEDAPQNPCSPHAAEEDIVLELACCLRNKLALCGEMISQQVSIAMVKPLLKPCGDGKEFAFFQAHESASSVVIMNIACRSHSAVHIVRLPAWQHLGMFHHIVRLSWSTQKDASSMQKMTQNPCWSVHFELRH